MKINFRFLLLFFLLQKMFDNFIRIGKLFWIFLFYAIYVISILLFFYFSNKK